MITGERQAARIRSLYLKSILRQDIAFFDQETSTGEVISRMSGDTILIQNAIGEKVCMNTKPYSPFKQIATPFPSWKRKCNGETNSSLHWFYEL